MLKMQIEIGLMRYLKYHFFLFYRKKKNRYIYFASYIQATAHLYICNKWGSILQCYGLTKDPTNEKFILVMSHMDIDLRKYILQHRNELTWKTKIQIIFEIIKAVRRIHDENSIHRDLHSGNVLYLKDKN